MRDWFPYMWDSMGSLYLDHWSDWHQSIKDGPPNSAREYCNSLSFDLLSWNNVLSATYMQATIIGSQYYTPYMDGLMHTQYVLTMKIRCDEFEEYVGWRNYEYDLTNPKLQSDLDLKRPPNRNLVGDSCGGDLLQSELPFTCNIVWPISSRMASMVLASTGLPAASRT